MLNKNAERSFNCRSSSRETVIRVTGSVVVAAVYEPPHEFNPALTERRYRLKQEIVHRAGIEPATQ